MIGKDTYYKDTYLYERRRLFDADPKRPVAAGYVLFQSSTEVMNPI